ncbi:MAG TPA: ATP-binding domain-containing protein, partial [Actinomycetota bacterium]|nr:ATP-binding domain-containing protein [Actinomycetota bacterium]
SMTVLGDLAQATAAGSQSSWENVLDALGRPPNAVFRELTVGYRVPSEVMEFANRLLPLAAPGTRPSTSVRRSDEPPRIVAGAGDLFGTAVSEVGALAALWQTVGLICPESLVEAARSALAGAGVEFGTWEEGLLDKGVVLLPPLAAKGLEFDAVVVVEPALFMLEDKGARRLYVALTRAVQQLTIVHDAPLPDVLSGAVV